MMLKYWSVLLLLLCTISRSKSAFINCTGSNQCHHQSLLCANDEDCVIYCDGDSACAFSRMSCPTNTNTACSVTCNGDLSCNNVIITARNATSLSVIGDGPHSVSNSHIYCPDTVSHNSCAVAYFGNDNGFNMMHLYTSHEYNTIRIECNSLDTCWSVNSNPTIHFGDSLYSNTCTIRDDCTILSDDVIRTSTAQNEADALPHSQTKDQGSFDINVFTLQLFLLGLLFGSIFLAMTLAGWCCLRYFWRKHKKPNPVERQNTNATDAEDTYCCTPIGTPKGVGKRTLSPSLMELSPVLTAVVIREDVANMNEHHFVLPNIGMAPMERYQSADLDSAPASLFSNGLSSESCIVIAADGITNGVAPDEFVVGGNEDM